MSESFRLYRVIETNDISAEELQNILNDATGGFPEEQIDHVIGTKIILGRESMLNEQGRAQARTERMVSDIANRSASKGAMK